MTGLGQLLTLVLVGLLAYLLYYYVVKVDFPVWRNLAEHLGLDYRPGRRGKPAMLTGLLDGHHVEIGLKGDANQQAENTEVTLWIETVVPLPRGLQVTKETLGRSISRVFGTHDFEIGDWEIDQALHISGADPEELERFFRDKRVTDALNALVTKANHPLLEERLVSFQRSFGDFLSNESLEDLFRTSIRWVAQIEETLLVDGSREATSLAWSASDAKLMRVRVHGVQHEEGSTGAGDDAGATSVEPRDAAAAQRPVDSLISGLQQEGEAVSAGVFTLDRAAALEKLRGFQLAAPEAYLLWLVQALVGKDATEIRIELEPAELTLRADGEGFDAHDFEELHASIFAPVPDAAARARRQLALGLNAALRFSPRELEVVSGGSGTAAQLSMRPDADDRITSAEVAGPGTRIRIVAGRHKPSDALLEELRELVEDRCRFADLPILLHGERVSQGLDHPALRGRLRLDSGSRHGVCGFLPELDDATELRLVQDGVVVARETLGGVAPGFAAIVADPRCRLDLSAGAIVQDDHHARLLRELRRAEPRAVAALCDELEAAPPGADEAGRWSATVVRRLLRTFTTVEELREDEEAARLARIPAYETIDGALVSMERLLRRGEETGHIEFSDVTLAELCISTDAFEHPDIVPALTLHLHRRSDVIDRCFLFSLLRARLRSVTRALIDHPRDPDLLERRDEDAA